MQAGYSRTRRERPLTASMQVRGRSLPVWRVEDSNLGSFRDGFTVRQRRGADQAERASCGSRCRLFAVVLPLAVGFRSRAGVATSGVHARRSAAVGAAVKYCSRRLRRTPLRPGPAASSALRVRPTARFERSRRRRRTGGGIGAGLHPGRPGVGGHGERRAGVRDQRISIRAIPASPGSRWQGRRGSGRVPSSRGLQRGSRYLSGASLVMLPVVAVG